MFERSVLPQKKLRCTKYLGDGDSAFFKKILVSKPHPLKSLSVLAIYKSVSERG